MSDLVAGWTLRAGARRPDGRKQYRGKRNSAVYAAWRLSRSAHSGLSVAGSTGLVYGLDWLGLSFLFYGQSRDISRGPMSAKNTKPVRFFGDS